MVGKYKEKLKYVNENNTKGEFYEAIKAIIVILFRILSIHTAFWIWMKRVLSGW